MQKHRMRLFPTLAAGLTLLSLAGGWTTSARAAIAYAFAEQTISGLTITPTVTPTSAVILTTQDGASVNGSGTTSQDALNVLQTYIGGTPAAPENFFARYAPGNPPVSPTTPTDFTRGDAAIPIASGPGNTSSVVAESYLNTANGLHTSEGASAGLNASFSFTVPTATTLAINYNFANDIFVFTNPAAPPNSATADYHFNITIKDAAGNIVFTSATVNTNLSLVSPPSGGEIIKAGNETVTTPTLSVGTGYTLIFSSTAQDSVAAAVPEPSVTAMLGVAGLFGLGYYRKSRGRRVAA